MFINYSCLVYCCRLVFLALLVYSAKGLAGESLRGSWHGFANIGVSYSNDEDFDFRTSLLNKGRDNVSLLPDSLLGLQGNLKLSSKIDAVGQVILQDRNDKHLSNFVEMAFLRYHFNRSLSAKIGRFSSNSYLYTDYRYVGHALTWLRPPLELYSPVGSIGNIDGIKTDYIHDVEFGAVKLGLAYGKSTIHNNGSQDSFRFVFDKMTALSIEVQSSNWRVQAAYLTAITKDIRVDGDEELRSLDQVVPDIFIPVATQIKKSLIGDGLRVSFGTIGGSYTQNNLQIMSEVAKQWSDWKLSLSSFTAYVSANYNMAEFDLEHVTPFVTLSSIKNLDEPEAFDVLRAQAMLPENIFEQLILQTRTINQSVLNRVIDQRSVSIGVRYDIDFDWALTFQFDHFKPDGFGSAIFRVPSDRAVPSTKESYNVVALSLTTTF